MLKRIFSALLCAVLLAGAVGCASAGDEQPSDNTTTTTTATTTTAPQKQYNIVTGLEDIELGSPTRPIGIMISNDYWASRPQTNIDKADMYVEIETEGAVTRLMAIFGSVDKVPTEINPVRSARTPFVKIAQALDLVYIHAGGSANAKSMLKQISMNEIDALGGANSSAFWRDATLKSQRGTEYSMTTGAEKLSALIEKKGYKSTAQADMPFEFGTVTGSGAGTTAQIKVSASETVTFKYADGVYTKYLGDASSTEKHTSIAGNPIQVSNVIVIYGSKYAEDVDGTTQTYGFNLSSGNGTVISGGTSRNITYKLSADGFTMYEADGSKLKLNTGKTYLCVADNSYKSKLVLN